MAEHKRLFSSFEGYSGSLNYTIGGSWMPQGTCAREGQRYTLKGVCHETRANVMNDQVQVLKLNDKCR